MSNVIAFTRPNRGSCNGCGQPLPNRKRAWCDDCAPARTYDTAGDARQVDSSNATRARRCRCARPLLCRDELGDVTCGHCGREPERTAHAA